MRDNEEKDKSWKKRTEELSKKAEEWTEEADKLAAELESLKSPSDGGTKKKDNPRNFEEAILDSQTVLLRGVSRLITQQGEILRRFDSFEWASKKRWWITIVLTIVASIFGSSVLSIVFS